MAFRVKKILLSGFLLIPGLAAFTQRVYAPQSVLATGRWGKLSVEGAGVYKIDVAFLNALGFTGSIPSVQIRLYGNGGGMLPEDNSQSRVDDLQEVAVQVADGGDGVVSGSDYILFYAQGADHWQADASGKNFNFLKNLFSNKSFYYITIGGTGKRIGQQASLPAAAITTTTFDEHYHYELDSVNLLSSGKEWPGEEFADAPGRLLTRNFQIPFGDVVAGAPVTVTSNVVSRSIGAGSTFNVNINNGLVQQLFVPPISGGMYDLYAQQVQQQAITSINSNNLNISYQYLPGSFNAQGWLNWFNVFFRRQLSLPQNGQMVFRDAATAGNSAINFSITNANSVTQVWDVTAAAQPVQMAGVNNGGQYFFTNEAITLHEYVTFSNTFLIPKAEGVVPNQNLHNTSEVDYIIITHPEFLAQAQRLALFHQKQNILKTLLVTTDQVYNEFSSGIPDPTAIRDFVKMYYDKYRSAWAQGGKYLLLFGKASFDYKNRIRNNTSFVPAYESAASLDPLGTYTSDDFFGFLDDNENINSSLIINQLDIGIGRVPVKNVEEAKAFVDKIETYHSAAAMGPWRTNTNFIADDEDNNLHLQDAETITTTAASVNPLFNQSKIYLDAFKQESSGAGGRYPTANAQINNNIFNGTLIWNYSGHGGPARLAEEVVLDQQIVANWQNEHRLPLFITATCDFAPFDRPDINSLGENLLTRPKTGAIALMTTTRVVFAFSNRILNNNYIKFALEKNAGGKYRSLGESIQAAKNYTYQTSSDIINNRKFGLLGDPAMTLAYPTLNVVATSVNGKNITIGADTLSATDNVIIEGEVKDNNGVVMNDFNGTVYLSLYDKPQTITTLGNDAGSQPVQFSSQSSLLFKGKATAVSGKFSLQFKMPKDINFKYGFGKISLYAQDGVADGAGFTDNVMIGGIGNAAQTDNVGPVIKAYLNDDRFVNGSITNTAPVLLVNLTDSSGINISSNSIDHEIVATLDGDNRTYYVLNNFYESELDNYQKGKIKFQLPELSVGAHSLKIKAWDVLNNSSEIVLDFTVVKKEDLAIDHVLNYPNPFTTNTTFWFEHNQPMTDMRVKVEIYTVSGKLVKSIEQAINTPGNRSNEVQWNGRDDYGAKLARGVYIYKLQVTANGKKASRWERLVLLN